MFGILYEIVPLALIIVLVMLDVFSDIKLGKGLRFIAGWFSALIIIALCLATPHEGRNVIFYLAFGSMLIFMTYFFTRASFGKND